MIQMADNEVVFSEQNFQKIIEHAPVGIVIIDKDLDWHLINQKFCEITGYTVRELKSMTFLDITYKEDINLNLSLYNQMIKGVFNEYFYEKRYVRKDGRIIWVRLSVAAVYLHGEYSHMVVSIQDIDESKKYQEAIEEANRELDILLYKASHDLKSPISTMEGLLKLLDIENPDIRESESFRHMQKTVRMLKHQNESIITLTQIIDHELNITDIRMEKFLSEITSLFRNKGSFNFSSMHNVTIRSDPYLLTILFENLLDNCIQFSDSIDTQVELQYSSESHGDVFIIRDNGPGIREEIQEKIFDMFYKGTEKSSGIGMGLFLVKKAVQKMDGEIEVKSDKKKGTIFKITLPVNKAGSEPKVIPLSVR